MKSSLSLLALSALLAASPAAAHKNKGCVGDDCPQDHSMHKGSAVPVPQAPGGKPGAGAASEAEGPPAYRGSGRLLPVEQLDAILKEKPMAMKGGGHDDSWLPYDDGQKALLARGFESNTFKSTQWGVHNLLDVYKEQYKDAPAQALKQGISDIVLGVRGVIDTGLEYAGVKEDSSLRPAEKKAKLDALDKQMGTVRDQLESIPLKGDKTVHEELMAVHPKYGEPGLMRIMNGVAGFDHMDETIAAHPASPALQVTAGNELLQQHNAGKAKEYFNNALSLEPGNVDALTGRAAANADLKDFAAAQADARAALAIDPTDPAALALAAMARDGAAGGVKIDKDSPFKKGADEQSLRAAPGVAQDSLKYLSPSNGAGLQSSAYTREALRALSVGDTEAALRRADRAVSLDPKNPDAYGLRAFAHARAGNYEAALKDAMASLALDPSNTMAHNARAKALNKMGLYNEALHAADDALRASPRNAYAYYMRAMALQGLGDRKGMIAALGAAAALDARYQDAYDLAKSAPAEQDMAFLFPEDQLAAAKAALAAQGGPAHRYWGMTMPVLMGAALACLAVLYWLTTLVPKARQAYATVVRQGPSLGTGAATIGLPTPAPLSGGRPGTQTGTVLRGQYRRLGQIGSSVHGAVFEGVDLSLQRPVAIRKLRAEMRASDQQRLLGPARAAAALNHAGIAPVYAVIEEGEALYLVSEFAPGRSLRDQLASNGPVPWEQALPLFRQVAAALDYAHGKGVAHGAIKASNLMISPEGRVRIIDFGLSRGPADAAGDLQAFGACLREAIAGLAPAQLDAVDAALLRSKGAVLSAAEILSVVETGLASAH